MHTYPTGVRERKISLSKSELDGAIEYSTDYIIRVLNCQRKIMPFDLIYGDGTIHAPLSKEETKELYEKLTKQYEASK